MKNIAFTFADHETKRGTHATILFAASNINTQIKIDIPAHVFHGIKADPKLFIIASIHGDELNSMEIMNRFK